MMRRYRLKVGEREFAIDVQVEAFHRKAKLLRGLGNRFKALAPVLGVLGLKPQSHVALCKVRCRRCECLAPC